MAGNEIKETLRAAADAVTQYIRDAAELRVETKVIVVGSEREPTLAASTTIRLDGDNTAVIPARTNDAGKWEIDTVLHELHAESVRSAVDYRARMLGQLLQLLRPTAGGGT